jgi:hypothetical protein
MPTVAGTPRITSRIWPGGGCADVTAFATHSSSALREAIEACGEEDLALPHPHAVGHQVWETVPGIAGHLGTHLMFWHLDHGEEAPAESAAMWAFDLESGFFPQPEQRADAAYNLACFYARVGRTEDAMTLLRDSLAAKPALIALARRDPDLDRIRDEPGFRELLAT